MKNSLCLLLVFSFLFSCKQQETTQTLLPSFRQSPSTPDEDSLLMHWNRALISQTPLNLKISQELVDLFVPADSVNGLNPVEQMANIWNTSLNNTTFFKLPLTATPNKDTDNLDQYQDSELGIYKSNHWFSEVATSALAITQYFAYKKNDGAGNIYLELVHADIMINFRDYEYFIGTPVIGSYDLQTVVLHEMGHFIGLPHNYVDSTSIMRTRIGTMEKVHKLSNSDLSYLNKLYIQNSSALTSSVYLNSAMSTGESPSPTLVRGVIELHSDGLCFHYLEGKLLDIH